MSRYSMYGKQSRKESYAIKSQAAEIIADALPYHLVHLFEQLLAVTALDLEVEKGEKSENEYFWYQKDGLKKALEHALTIGQVNKPEELLTAEEAAKFIQVSTSTIYRMIDNEELRAIRFGRLVRIDRKDLEKLVDRNRIGDHETTI